MPKLPVETALRTLDRVRRMSLGETLHRLVERTRSELERATTLLGMSIPAPRHSLSFLDDLRAGPALRFYFNPAARLRIFEFLAREFPEWIEEAEHDADRIAGHKIDLLGHGTIDLGTCIDWHRDPITGKKWPRRFWTDYDPVRECSAGDPKTVHEINRHGHLPRLAKGYFLTGQERYATEVVTQLSSWIEQNPPSLGINWQSSLEIALRCISWIWSLFFVLPSRALDEDSARHIGYSLFAQLEHVSRYPSIYSSPNTHLLGEATALFVAGVLFREHRRSSAWLKQGSALLLEQLKRQTTADGVHVELSTYYHCYTVDFYLQALVLAQRNGVSVPAFAWPALSRMIDFLQHIAAPDGSIPRLGDDDGGRGLTLCRNSYDNFDDAFSTAAVLFGREDFKQRSGVLREETFWLLGEDAASLYSKLQAGSCKPTAGAFPHAGYFVQRSDWTSRADRLIFDCGGLGQPSGGHGHADALSVTLAVRGRELLVDPGTFIYNTAPRWRDFFRSTRAHNTVVIDGSNQSEPGGTFKWKSAARVRTVRHLESPAYVEAEHDGYTRLREPVMHRRRVLRTDRYWTIADDFRGRGQHCFEMNFHFAPETRIHSAQKADPGNGLEVVCENGRAGVGIYLYGSSPLRSEVVSGQENPAQGWISRRYGHREAAPVLVARMSTGVPSSAMVCLFPFDTTGGRGAPALPEVRQLPSSPGVLVCEVRLEDMQDLLLFAPGGMAEIAVGELAATGEFFWLRLRAGRLIRAFAVNARTLSQGAFQLLAASGPRTFNYSAEAKEDCVTIQGTNEERHTCAEFVEL